MAVRFTGPVLNAEKKDGSRKWFSNLPVGSSPDYVVYMNDFLVAQDYDAADWVITTTEAGAGDATEALVADELNGALVITNDAADNDLDALQSTEECWKPTAGKRLWFESKVKFTDADDDDMFIGLAITDTTVLDASNRINFRVAEGDASILCQADSTADSAVSVDSGVDAADDTYVTLGFYWDGKNKVEYFVNRSLVHTTTSGIPTAENLAISIHFQNGAATADAMTIDYIYVCQER